MIRITEPGIYTLSAEDYHADPCPEPSLSGSVAIPLVHRSPLHAWHNHSRLNPAFEPVESKRFDIGSAVHRLVLGAGAEIVVIEADDYKKQATRDERDAAYAMGKIPLLAHDHETAQNMAAEASKFFVMASDGKAEQSIIWRERDTWCRGMVDWLSNDRQLVIDFKTTGTSAHPDQVAKTLFDMNYHLKAAFYERGLNQVDPANVGRRKFIFIFQETEAPYACSMHQLNESAMTIGRKQATYAIRRWQQCMEFDQWPSYPTLSQQAAPSWLERRWLEREEADPFATGALSPDDTPVRMETGRQSLVMTGD